MTGKTKAPKPSELAPVDWEAIEPHFRAGIRSYQSLSDEFGVSPAGILKHFRKKGITRDLKARILAKAADKVNAAAVNKEVNALTENTIIGANAEIVAAAHLLQRRLSNQALDIVGGMLNELQTTMAAPELFGQVHNLLSTGEAPDPALLRELAELVASLPAREKVVRGLIESLNRAVLLQRLTHGMDDKQKPPDASDSFETLRDLAEGAA